MKLVDAHVGIKVEVLMSTRASTGEPLWRPGVVIARDFSRNRVQIEFSVGAVYQITMGCDYGFSLPRVREIKEFINGAH